MTLKSRSEQLPSRNGVGVSIGVVTVCRNARHDLEATIDSVVAQSHPNVDYLVVDGASTDATVPYLERRAAHDGFRFISQPDDGIADAMNFGIRRSRGEIILHLHAGDRLHDRDVLTRVASSYAEHGWRWASGAVDMIGEGGDVVIEGDFRLEDGQTLQRLHARSPLHHQATFVHREVFDRFGGFDGSFAVSMDYEYWLRIHPEVRPYPLDFTVTDMLMGGLSARARLRAARESIRARRKHLEPYSAKQVAWDAALLIYRASIELVERAFPVTWVDGLKALRRRWK